MGNLFIITAPSGTGKSSLVRELVNRLPGSATSVSHTSRAPRGAEQDGVQYHFVTRADFQKMIEQDAFAEWTQIHGNYYGTSHLELRKRDELETGLILEIEGHGALQIKGQYPSARTVFILPPSLDELRNRITRRAEDSPGEIERRMQNAIYEIQYIDQFEFVVMNDVFDKAIEDLITIIRADQMRVERVWPAVADSFTR